MIKNTIYTTSLIFMTLSCTNASLENLVDADPIPIVQVTYDDNVKTIIDNNCIFCHSNPAVNGASAPLETFSEVKSAVENLNVINRISEQPGNPGAMPLGGERLPQNLIDIVIQWETDGLLEN